MTIQHRRGGAAQERSPPPWTEAASITASALLRGARGNSGVILSLLFRGISKGLKGMDERRRRAALPPPCRRAWPPPTSAVMKPAEGTVLTVSRLAAEPRRARPPPESNSVEYVLEEAIRKGHETLAQTIEMNPVLKKAGVVDAGGKGYLVILEGMLRALRGEPMPEVTEETRPRSKADFAAISDGGDHLHL